MLIFVLIIWIIIILITPHFNPQAIPIWWYYLWPLSNTYQTGIIFRIFNSKFDHQFTGHIFVYDYQISIMLILKKGKFNTGRPKKIDLGICLISLDTNMLEGQYIFNLKGGIHCCVWSTRTLLYDIWEPRHKQNNMGYKISRI